MSDINKISGSVELNAEDRGLLDTLKRIEATLTSLDSTMAKFGGSVTRSMGELKKKAGETKKAFKPTQVQIEKLDNSFKKLAGTRFGSELSSEMNKFKASADAGFKSAEDKALALYRIQKAVADATKELSAAEKKKNDDIKKAAAEAVKQASRQKAAVKAAAKAQESEMRKQAAAIERLNKLREKSERVVANQSASPSLTQLDNMRDKLNKMNEALARVGASGSANYTNLANRATDYFRIAEGGNLSQEKLSQTMNRFSKVTSEVVARVKEQERAALQLEKMLNRNDLATIELTESLKYMGASATDIHKVTQALRDYKTAVASAGGDQNKLVAAQNRYKTTIAAVRRENHNGSVVAFDAARNMGLMKDTLGQAAQAAQLALGPLAGLAYRLTVMKSMLNRTTFGITAMISSLVAMYAVISRVVSIGIQFEQEMAAIATVIQDDFGGALDNATERLMDFSREFAFFTLAGTQETRRAVVAVNTFGDSVQRLTPQVLMAAKGIQSAFGGTLVDRVRLVGKVLEDPLANMRSLKQAGIVLDDQMKSNIRFMSQMGMRGQAQAVVLEKLTKFMHLAAGEAKGLSGSWDTLKEKYLELQENFARETGITDTWSEAIVAVTELVERLNTTSVAFKLFAGASEAALSVVVGAIKVLADNMTRLVGVAFVAATVSLGMFVNGLLGVSLTSASVTKLIWAKITSLYAYTKALLVSNSALRKTTASMTLAGRAAAFLNVALIPALVTITLLTGALAVYDRNAKSTAEVNEQLRESFANVQGDVEDFTRTFLEKTDERIIAARRELAEIQRINNANQRSFADTLSSMSDQARRTTFISTLVSGFKIEQKDDGSFGRPENTNATNTMLLSVIASIRDVENQFKESGNVLTEEMRNALIAYETFLRTFENFEDVQLVEMFEESAAATERYDRKVADLETTLEALRSSMVDMSVDGSALLDVLQNMEGSALANTDRLNALINAEIAMGAATTYSTEILEALNNRRQDQLKALNETEMVSADMVKVQAAINSTYEHQIYLLTNLAKIKEQQRTRELVNDYRELERSLAKLGRTQEEVANLELQFDRQDFVEKYMNKVDPLTASTEELAIRLEHLGRIAENAGNEGLASLARNAVLTNDRMDVLNATSVLLNELASKLVTPTIEKAGKATERAAKDTDSLSDSYRSLIREAKVLQTTLDSGTFAAARLSESFELADTVEDFRKSLSELSESELSKLASDMDMAGASAEQLAQAMHTAQQSVYTLGMTVEQQDYIKSMVDDYNMATVALGAANAGFLQFSYAVADANDALVRAAQVDELLSVYGSVEAALQAISDNFGDVAYAVDDAMTPLEKLNAMLIAIEDRKNLAVKITTEMEAKSQTVALAAETFAGILENSLLNMEWAGVGSAIATAVAVQMKSSIGGAISDSLANNMSEQLASSIGGMVGGVAGSFAVGVAKFLWRELTKQEPKLTNEEIQARQGAGGVLGDMAKKNTTIADMTTKLTSINAQILGVNVGMLSALNRLNNAIGGASQGIVRSGNTFDVTPDSVFKEIGTQMVNTIGAAATGAAIGAATGAFAGPAGMMLGGAIGGIIGTAVGATNNFIKGQNKITAQGINFGGNMGDLVDGGGVSAYAIENQKTFRWSRGKDVRHHQQLSEESQAQFALIFGGMADTMVEAFKSLGASAPVIDKAIEDMMNTSFGNIDVNLTGLNAEKQAKEIEATIGKMFDDVVQNVAPSVAEFQKVGESLADTFFRLASDAAYGQEMIKSLGFQLSESFGTGVDDLMQQAAVFSDFFERFGGANEAVRAMENFRNKFQSESDAFENQTRRITAQFSQMGMVLPRTREELFEMQQGLDLIADADKLEVIYKSADALDAYYKAMEKVNEEADKAVEALEKDVLDAWKAFQSQSQDLTMSLKELISSEEALAYARELELAAIDPLLKETQKMVWRLQDEAKAKEEAARAGEEYNKQIRSSRDSLKQFRDSVSSFIADILGQTSNNVSGALLAKQYEESLAGAKAGDNEAMGRVLGDAKSLLDYQQSTATSAFEQARNAAIMANQLKTLGDKLTPEQILVNALEKGFSDLEKAMRGLPPELAEKLQVAYSEIDMIANIVMNDPSLSPEMRTLLANIVSGNRTMIDLVLNDSDISKKYKDLISGVAIQTSAVMRHAFAPNVPESIRSLLLDQATTYDTMVRSYLDDQTEVGLDKIVNLGKEQAKVTIEAALGKKLTDEEFALIMGVDNTLTSTINAVMSGNLTAEQKALLFDNTTQINSQLKAILGTTITDEQKALLLGAETNVDATIKAIGTLTDEQKKLVMGGNADLLRTIITTDNLEQWQRDLITATTGGNVKFDVDGRLVLGSSANNSLLTTAELAQRQLTELNKIYEENKLVVEGLNLLTSEMGGLTTAINELAGINERQADIARANVRIAEIEANKKTVQQRADANIDIYKKEADDAWVKMMSASNSFEDSVDATVSKMTAGAFLRYELEHAQGDSVNALSTRRFRTIVDEQIREAKKYAGKGMAALNKYAEDLETRTFYPTNRGLDEEVRKAMRPYIEMKRANEKRIEYHDLVLKEQRLLTEALKRLSAELAEQKTIVGGGFASGGYTGSGTKNAVAGVVHAGEYVIPAAMLRRMGGMSAVASLEAMRNGGGEYQGGGLVGGIIASGSSSSADYDELVYELKELRRELVAIKESNATMATNSVKAERRESKWDVDGLPPTRT